MPSNRTRILALTAGDPALRAYCEGKLAHKQRGRSSGPLFQFSPASRRPTICDLENWQVFHEPEVIPGYRGIIATDIRDGSTYSANKENGQVLDRELRALGKLHDSIKADGIAINLKGRIDDKKIIDALSKWKEVEFAFYNVAPSDQNLLRAFDLLCFGSEYEALNSLRVEASDSMPEREFLRHLMITTMPNRYKGIDFARFRETFSQDTNEQNLLESLEGDIKNIKIGDRRFQLVFLADAMYMRPDVRKAVKNLARKVERFSGDFVVIYNGDRITFQALKEEHGLFVFKTRKEALDALETMRGFSWIRPPENGWQFFEKPRATKPYTFISAQDTNSVSSFNLGVHLHFNRDIKALLQHNSKRIFLYLGRTNPNYGFVTRVQNGLLSELDKADGVLIVYVASEQTRDALRKQGLNAHDDITLAKAAFDYHIKPPVGGWEKLTLPVLIDSRGIVSTGFKDPKDLLSIDMADWLDVADETRVLSESRGNILFDLEGNAINSGAADCLEILQRDLLERHGKLVVISSNPTTRKTISEYSASPPISVHSNRNDAIFEIVHGISPPEGGFKNIKIETRNDHPGVVIVSIPDESTATAIFRMGSSTDRELVTREFNVLKKKPFKVVLVLPDTVKSDFTAVMYSYLLNFNTDITRIGGSLTIVCPNQYFLNELDFLRFGRYKDLESALLSL